MLPLGYILFLSNIPGKVIEIHSIDYYVKVYILTYTYKFKLYIYINNFK